MVTPNEVTLEYSISEKSPYLVVSFSGVFNGATVSVVEKSHQEIIKKFSETSIKYVILNLQNVTKLDGAGIPSIQRLKKTVKDNHATMHLCAEKLEMKSTLLNAGIFGVTEMSDLLQDALQKLQSKK